MRKTGPGRLTLAYRNIMCPDVGMAGRGRVMGQTEGLHARGRKAARDNARSVRRTARSVTQERVRYPTRTQRQDAGFDAATGLQGPELAAHLADTQIASGEDRSPACSR